MPQPSDIVVLSHDQDDCDSVESIEPEDKIFCEFTKIQRTKMKFKCEFKNAIVHVKGQDYVIKNLSGDIEY